MIICKQAFTRRDSSVSIMFTLWGLPTNMADNRSGFLVDIPTVLISRHFLVAINGTVGGLRKTPRRHDTLGEANPLTGLLFCADCGAKMTNHRSKGGTENNPYPSDFYDCSTYTLAHQKRTHACSGHYIRTRAVRELVLETIRTASTFAPTFPYLQSLHGCSQRSASPPADS